MSITVNKTGSWPPKGWPQFKTISQKSNQALVKDLKTARIYGLSYKIQSMPLYHMDGKYFAHTLDITGWEYTIHNDSQEYPVLSFKMLDRQDTRRPYQENISNIKVFARPVEDSTENSKRTVLAGLFLMKQINAGFVPDPARVLRVYRLMQENPLGAHNDMAVPYAPQKFFSYSDQN